MRPINCGFSSLKGKANIVNPINKIYSIAYKVQQTFFVPEQKQHELGEQHETCLVLKSHYSYWSVFYLVNRVRESNWKKIVVKQIITYVEREVKDSRSSGMSQSCFFCDKIGHAKSVGLRPESAIWLSESRITSGYLEITSSSLIYYLIYSSVRTGFRVTRHIRWDSK